MINRGLLNLLKANFGRKKVIVLLGARQVGKTTLLNELQVDYNKVLPLNCDDSDDVLLIESKSSSELKNLLSPYQIVFIDEAQRVKNIGLILKMIGDLQLDTQVVVTGSSSLEMANEINEPATGRIIEFNLFPFSLKELADNSSKKDVNRLLPNYLIYGLYPEVVTDSSFARQTLLSLANNYLYKDILSYKGIRKPEILQKLVRALALQIGSEVSYNELSNLLGIDKATVETYIDLLEKCFVVFKLDSYSTNQRNEIKKGKKIYFYDNGIRNAVLSNFAPLELRNDIGALWENFMISERIKYNKYNDNYANLYFWRTHEQQEIDLIEEKDNFLSTFEFKWNPKSKAKVPKTFVQNYPNSSFELIHPDNFWSFIEGDL